MSYASIEEAMTSGHGIERSFCCHVHQDNVASASVNSLTGLWFCYACGAKGKYNVTDVTPAQFSAQLRAALERLDNPPRTYGESWLSLYDSMGPGQYWLDRFGEEICRLHRLGQDPAGRFATIPVRDEMGRILGVIRRDLTGEDRAKYRYPSGVDMSKHLYNHHRVTGDVLLLTEGATDAIAAEEAGFPTAVATYRNGVSRAQERLILQYAPRVVLVAYDQDDKGEMGATAVYDRLNRRVPVDRLTWDTYKDLAAIPLSDRTAMMSALSEQYG